MPQAFIFDLNGTMINDMLYHELAWYDILVNELHAPLSRDDVKGQMYGKNEEMLVRVFGAGKFTQEEMDAIVARKEIRYRNDFLPHLELIKGLGPLLAKAKVNHIRMAIGTAAIKGNVDFVLDNLQIREYFPVIVGPEDVKKSKPDPEVFSKAAELSGVAPGKCIVFEDSPKGIEAARRAGMKAVGITTYHTADELKADNVLCIIDDYTDKALNELIW